MIFKVKKIEYLNVVRLYGCSDLGVVKHKGKYYLCTFGSDAWLEHTRRFSGLTWVTLDGVKFEQIIEAM